MKHYRELVREARRRRRRFTLLVEEPEGYTKFVRVKRDRGINIILSFIKIIVQNYVEYRLCKGIRM
jgi:hypothetical protein